MKMDLKIGWNATINVGNYSNVHPDVEIVLKNVDALDPETYKKLEEIVAPLFVMQLYNLLIEVDTAMALNPRGKYLDSLKDNIDNVEGDFKKAVEDLKELQGRAI